MNHFRNELEQHSSQLNVTSTGVDFITDSAQRRTRRRRTTVAVGGALSLAAVTIGGVQQLSGVDDGDTIEIPSADDDSPVAAAEETAVTTIVSPVGPAASSRDPKGNIQMANGRPFIDGAVPAQRGESHLTWNVVEEGSAEELGLRFDTDTGLALATEPGTAEQPGPSPVGLWQRSDDGEWEQVASDVLPSGLRQAVTTDATIYAIGTAPAVAGGTPGSVGAYDVAVGAWEQWELPPEALPTDSDLFIQYTTFGLAPLEQGVLVSASVPHPHPDYGKVAELVGGDAPSYYPPVLVDEGIEVSTECDIPALETAVREEQHASDWFHLRTEHCVQRLLTWDELGATPAEIDAARSGTRSYLWRVIDGKFVPVESPDPTANFLHIRDNILYTSTVAGPDSVAADGSMWAIGADGGFTRLFDGFDTSWIWSGTLGDDTAIASLDSYLLSQNLADASMVVADTSDLLRPVDAVDGVTSWASTSSATLLGTTIVATADASWSPAETITEPVSMTDSGFELTIDPATGEQTVVDVNSGQEIYNYSLSTSPNGLVLSTFGAPGDTVPPATAPATTMLTTTTTTTTLMGSTPSSSVPGPPHEELAVATFPIDWQTVPGFNQQYENAVISSVDGVTFGVDYVHEIFGVDADTPVGVISVTSTDDRFVITAAIGDYESGDRLVAVGTPNN